MSSAEDLGVVRDPEEGNNVANQTKSSPALDRAALYRLVMPCLTEIVDSNRTR